jgi:hypothetical protein
MRSYYDIMGKERTTENCRRYNGGGKGPFRHFRESGLIIIRDRLRRVYEAA